MKNFIKNVRMSLLQNVTMFALKHSTAEEKKYVIKMVSDHICECIK